jgi:hypothetical protein
MKKLFSLLVVAGMAALIACGPSAEELAKKDQAKKDSIAKVKQDSTDQANLLKAKEDSTIAANKAKAIEDSIAAASTKKGGTKPAAGGNKPATDPKKVKAGQGKG